MCICIRMCLCISIYIYISLSLYICADIHIHAQCIDLSVNMLTKWITYMNHRDNIIAYMDHRDMGWLRLVGSIKL